MKPIEQKRASQQSRIAVTLEDVEVRDSGAGDGSYTVRGYAAVYDRLSLDLGGFQEKIDKGAFTNVLDRMPAVVLDWDHDTRFTLANTANGTLELRETPHGLHTWARVAPTSYAADLRVLLERGDISQMSFMFTIAQERWEWDGEDDSPIVATIEEIGDLYDVTVTARGAYPQTDVSLASLATRRLETALREGLVPGHPSVVAPPATEAGADEEDPERTPVEGDGSEVDAPDVPVVSAQEAHTLAVEQAKRRRAGA